MDFQAENLILHFVTEDDLSEVARTWPSDHHPLSDAQAREAIAYMRGNYARNVKGCIFHLCLAVCRSDDPRTIMGWCGLDGTRNHAEPEIFILLDEAYRRQGYGTRCVKELLRIAAEDYALSGVHGGCAKENIASARAMEKGGMARYGAEENGDPLFRFTPKAKTGTESAKSPGQMTIRQATEGDVRQIAEILVEDWKKAYRGIMDSAFLDAMSVEQRCQIERQRYQKYVVAVEDHEVLGYAWNEMIDDEAADCEIIALYVRYSKRKSGIGRALMLNSMDYFRRSGKKSMILWCLEANDEARKFYEKMGGKPYKAGTHRWGDKDYNMVSYLYPLETCDP